MQFLQHPSSLLALSGVLVCAACGGGDQKMADTAAASAGAPAAAASSGPAVVPAGSAIAATGKTTDVRMIGDAQGYRFEPANVTIKVGDAVRWFNVSGGPHNVTFWPDSVPGGVPPQLAANMPNPTAPLTGPLLVEANATYPVSFAGLKPGVYHYYCTPHLALGMKATVTVQ